MRIPVLLLLVVALALVAVIYLFDSAVSGDRRLGVPRIEQLADLEGTETEVALAPDGTRILAVADGDLWLLDTSNGFRQRLTSTPEPESAPAWAPGAAKVTYTRGRDTFSASVAPAGTANAFREPEVFKENATSLTWAPSGALAFVRDRALWVAGSAGEPEREVVPAEAAADITIREPRFSPDSLTIAFLKSTLGLRAEIWLVDARSGTTRILLGDRLTENPTGIGWLDDNRLACLTNRSGTYALWVFDITQNSFEPLTSTLTGVPLRPLGLDIHNDRIVVPRHSVDSDIVVSGGSVVAETEDLEFEPAVSADGTRVAYTVLRNNAFEIWTAGIDGANPRFHVLGTEPRFSPNGYQLVYTNTSVLGEVDLRRVDIRDGSSTSVTDALEADFQADWSPNGRWVVFASGIRSMSLWTAPAAGGKRVHLAPSGYYPRFTPESASVFFWDQRAYWRIPTEGGKPVLVRAGHDEPAPAVWVKNALRDFRDPEVHGGKLLWPRFDVLPNGTTVTAPIEVRETALWTVELTYVAAE